MEAAGRNQSPVALAVMTGERALTKLAQQFDVNPAMAANSGKLAGEPSPAQPPPGSR